MTTKAPLSEHEIEVLRVVAPTLAIKEAEPLLLRALSELRALRAEKDRRERELDAAFEKVKAPIVAELNGWIEKAATLESQLSRLTSGPVRELTDGERATWGECPVCFADDGAPCSFRDNLAVVRAIENDGFAWACHVVRRIKAPRRVRLVPITDETEKTGEGK